MNEQGIFTIHEPYRDNGTILEACTPGLEMPKGIANIPGYLAKVREVHHGLRDPFWGFEYRQDGRGKLADLVMANSVLYAASEQLKQVLEEAGLKGVLYHPIRVDGRTPMYILGVQGRVDVHPAPLEYRLLDGAEIGIYGHSFIHVSARVAGLIRMAGLDMEVERSKVHPRPPWLGARQSSDA